MSNEVDNRPRRNLGSTVIEPFKQIKFGIYVVAISVIFVAICSAMFGAAFYDQYQHVMKIFNVVDPDTKWELVLNDVFVDNAWRIGWMFLAYIIIVMTVVFRLTHRYYGPLVSIERFVDEIAEGDYTRRCKIRNKDELHGLVDKLNNMAEQLQGRHGRGIGERRDERREDDQAAS